MPAHWRSNTARAGVPGSRKPRKLTSATFGWSRRKAATTAALALARALRSGKVSSERSASQLVKGIEMGAEQGAKPPERADDRLVATDRAADEVAVAAGIFGQRRHREIGTVLERRLQQRSQEGVVDDDNRTPPALPAGERVGSAGDHCDIGDAVGRVGRCLDEDEADRPMPRRRLGGLVEARWRPARRQWRPASRRCRRWGRAAGRALPP